MVPILQNQQNKVKAYILNEWSIFAHILLQNYLLLRNIDD